MAMQAGTVEILIEKAKFEPRVAVAVAEAMDQAFDARAHHLQLVTLPVLDDRLAALREKLEDKIDGLEERLESEIAGIETRLEGKVAGIETRLEGKIAGIETPPGPT